MTTTTKRTYECQFCDFTGGAVEAIRHRGEYQHLIRIKQSSGTWCTECSGTTHMPWCSEYEESGVVRCELCAAHTPSKGTKRCDRCWELETRIQNDPLLAQKILAVEQRLFGERLQEQSEQLARLTSENERLRVLLRGAVSPTHCYCAVMNGKKCWQCEVREALNHAARGEGK